MNYSDLKEGDLIRALITDEGLKGKQREHCFIIFNEHKIKDASKKRHRICIPACSLSSKFPKCDGEIYIEINTDLIPPNLFNESKDQTLLRIGRPKCVERYQFKEYRTNLKAYPEFWKEICEKVQVAFPEDLGGFDAVCDCQCLVDNDIDVGYCEQEETYLISKHCEMPHESKKICSACGFEFNNLHHEFELCQVCCNNNHVIIIDTRGCEFYIDNPNC